MFWWTRTPILHALFSSTSGQQRPMITQIWICCYINFVLHPYTNCGNLLEVNAIDALMATGLVPPQNIVRLTTVLYLWIGGSRRPVKRVIQQWPTKFALYHCHIMAKKLEKICMNSKKQQKFSWCRTKIVCMNFMFVVHRPATSSMQMQCTELPEHTRSFLLHRRRRLRQHAYLG